MLLVRDEAVKFVLNAHAATSTEDLSVMLMESLRSVGVRLAYCVRIAAPGQPVLPKYLYGFFDPHWVAAYSKCRCALFDPIIPRIFANNGPIFWSDLRSNLSPAELSVLALAAEYGHHDGVTVPVLGQRGDVCAVVITAKERLELTSEDRALLLTLATTFAMRGLSLLAPDQIQCPNLTLREKQCLSWAARGKSDWEIGEILSIAERTAHMFVESAKRKFATRSRHEAILGAWQRGWLLDLPEVKSDAAELT